MRDFDGSLGFPRTTDMHEQPQPGAHPLPPSHYIYGEHETNQDQITREWRDRKYATREAQPVPWVEPLRLRRSRQ